MKACPCANVGRLVLKSLILAVLLALAPAGGALSATFTVTSAADSGSGSLRQAIVDANANPGTDAIEFNIAGAGPHTIQPVSALPTVTESLTIDGLTQSGADCSSWPAGLQVVINGAQAPNGSNGLVLSGGDSIVRGLVINGFRSEAAILIDSDSNAVECNILGTDATGTSAEFALNNDRGVHINGGNNNIVGGTVVSKRNLISNNDDGVLLEGGATLNTLAGNLFGTDITGMVALENDAGIVILDAPGNTIGGTDHDAGVCNKSCNLISGSDFDGGIVVDDFAADDLVIQGNFIGTDILGTAAIPNGDSGVEIDEAASGILIGGFSDPGVCSKACNLISGNDDHGILVDEGQSDGIVIQGNFIGTDASGTLAVPNLQDGIEADGAGHTVGGATPGLGNLISGNGDLGIDFSVDGGIIAGNLIGVAIDEATPLGNGEGGILVGGNDNRIGGIGAGEGNIIAFNDSATLAADVGGVAVSPGANTGNAILGNRIYSNAGLGIDLTRDGVSGNDADDSDSGSNNLQNFPVLDDIPTLTGAAATAVRGGLQSVPSTDFRLEFFASEACDAPGFGEGQIVIDAIGVTTDDDGLAVFDETFSTDGIAEGWVVTATATRLDGSGNPVETSEFSQCADLPGSPVVTTTSDSGPGSLREAILYANANAGTDVISFDIDAASDPGCDAGTGVCILQAVPPMPDLNSDTLIDGTTQPGASCASWPPALKIVFPNTWRPRVTGDHAAIRGLVLFALDLVANNARVTCNFVGSDMTGSVVALSGGGLIVGDQFGGTGNVIGGTTPTERNLISGNNTWGLELRSGGNTVQGNFIGTDVTGQSALPNRLAGVAVSPSSSALVGTNLIGGTVGTTPGGACTGPCNLISGNDAEGINLRNLVGAAVFNDVRGNAIGIDVTGTSPLGNALAGIRIQDDGNLIGGTDPAARNTIAHNGGSGVALVSGGISNVAAVENRIAGNAIFANGGPGIDLEADGVTVNDPGDGDEGANNLQNYPEIVSITGDEEATLAITYTVPSDPVNSAYPLTIEFYLADADGEEGQTFVGRTDYPVGEAGQQVTAVFSPQAAVANGAEIVATATDAAGNTSEFAAAAAANGSATPDLLFADGFEASP